MGVYRRGKTWCILYYQEGRRIREAVGPSKRAAEQALAARKADYPTRPLLQNAH